MTATEPTMSIEQSALLRAILTHPEDDTARLVYADWLQENDRLEEQPCPTCSRYATDHQNPWGRPGFRPERDPGSGRHEGGWCNCQTCNFMGGRPGVVMRRNGNAQRAEFIRVQVELARLRHDNDEETHCINRLRRRERELRQANAPIWFAVPGLAVASVWDHPPEVRWCAADDHHEGIDIVTGDTARGFLASVTCTAADWLAHADALAWHPGQTVGCCTCGGCGGIQRPLGNSASYWAEKGCPACSGKGRMPRPMPPTAQPVTRVVLTDGRGGFRIHEWLRGSGICFTAVRWIDPNDRDKGFTDERWPGITFELPGDTP